MRIEIVQHNVNLFVRIFGYQLVHEIQKFASAPAPIMPACTSPVAPELVSSRTTAHKTQLPCPFVSSPLVLGSRQWGSIGFQEMWIAGDQRAPGGSI